MKHYVAFSSTILAFLLSSAMPANAQTSWGDSQPQGSRESASTALFHPSRFAFDGDPNTAWNLVSGSTAGWAEQYWSQSKRLASVTVSLQLPEGAELAFSSLQGNLWVPIPGARIAGPVNGNVTLVMPGELPPTSRVLASLSGASTDQAQVWGISWAESAAPQPYGKILPLSYTFNQKEYINLKPTRLWDGIVGNGWYSALWSVPQEAFNTGAGDQPKAIFPPYNGDPPNDGEIIWQLDGTYAIKTIKAYFVRGYQSVQFQFWDGTKWSNTQVFGGGWSDSGQGWQRIDLATPVTTTKVRITFPGGWGRANAVGELEFWGQGWSATPAQSLLVPTADSGSYHFTYGGASADNKLEVSVAGKTTGTLTGEWNGVAFGSAPATWNGGDTIYRVPIARETFRQDVQFLKLTSPSAVRSAVIAKDLDSGKVDLGWPWSDGQFAASAAGPSLPVPTLTSKTWTFSVPYQLERLRVFAASQPGTFKTLWKGHATVVGWTNQGSGWWEANLAGIQADQLSFVSPTPMVLDEIQLWGTPLTDTKVGIEVWWPQNAVASSVADGVSVIGWMGDPSVQPLIGTFHPRQADKVFWMPLAQMGMSPGQAAQFVVRGTLGSAASTVSLPVAWRGASTPATLDQGTSLAVATQNTLTLSGSVTSNGSRVFVQGAEVPVSGRQFTVAVTLKNGFQLLDVQVWDHPKNHLLAQFSKPVYRTVGAPLLQFGLPAGDLWTQGSSLPLSGLVGNGVGLTLSVGGSSVPLTNDTWTKTVALTGTGVSVPFVLKDSAGRETDRVLNISRAASQPTAQILTPAKGAFLTSSSVTLSVKGSDPQYWWMLNGGSWTPAYTQTVTSTSVLADGFYTNTVFVQNRAGNISPAATVSFCVDTTPPAPFLISADVSGWTNNNRPKLTFATTDATSGLDHFEAVVDTGAFASVSSPFQVPVLSDGTHTVFVKAVDKAGLATLASIELNIDTATPGAPTNVRAVPGLNKIDLSWTPIPEPGVLASLPLTYEIERSPAWPDGLHTVSQQQYSDEGLPVGATYSYRVTAIDVAGNRSAATGWVTMQAGVGSSPVSSDGPTIVSFNQASVVVPQGATAPDIVSVQVIQIPDEDADASPAHTLVSPIFQFAVTRESATGTTVTLHADFAAPVSIQLTYDPARIPAGMDDSNLKPFYFDEIWGQWLPIEGSLVDTANHVISFQTNHFSAYSVQADGSNDVALSQMRERGYSPLASTVGQAPMTVSPQSGVVSTAFTEARLPGKGGFDLVVQRVYSSAQAQIDAGDKDSTKDGSTPWSLGSGWRLNFPYLKWNGNALWVTDADGNTASVGQMGKPTPTGITGEVKTFTFVNHEGSDYTFVVTLQPERHHVKDYFLFWQIGSHDYYTYNFSSAKLFMKDGREVDFDASGQVTSMYDATHSNEIQFEYSKGRPSTITDSLGRKVTFGLNPFVNTIHTISLEAGGRTPQPLITYDYQVFGLGVLKAATDIGGRKWTYEYDDVSLTKKTHVLTSGYADPSPKTVKVGLLTNVRGPGVNSNVSYDVREGSFTTSQQFTSNGHTNSVSFSVTENLPVGASLTVKNGATPIRTTSYGYSLVSGGPNQLYVLSATVNDGRSRITNSFSHVSLTRTSLSDAPEALTGALGTDTGVRLSTNEFRTYLSTSRLASLNTTSTVAELRQLTWDWDSSQLGSLGKGRVMGDRTSRGSAGNNFIDNTSVYDDWGNLTQSVLTSSVPVGSQVRRTKLENRYSYYNAGDADLYLSLGETEWGVKLTEPGNTIAVTNHALMAAHVRTVSGWTPANAGNTPDSNIQERTSYQYNPTKALASDQPQGSLRFKLEWLGGTAWGKTSYTYDATSGELTAVVGPLDAPAAKQETDYGYSYSNKAAGKLASSDKSYTITTTQKSVKLDSAGSIVQDLVTVNEYDALNGANLTTTIDPNGKALITTRTFDELGRVRVVEEPAEGGLKPTTGITYDDTPGELSSIVTDPLGLVTTNAFDDLGRLTKIEKNAGSEKISTSLAYDAWNDVLSISGPWSNKETSRTQTDLTKTFTYDFRGRVTSTTYPGSQTSKNSFFDDTQNLVTTSDEMLNQTTQTVDWWGNTVVQKSYPSPGTTILTQAFYDGLGRVIATIDPDLKETDLSYNEQGFVSRLQAPVRDVFENGSTVSSVRPETNNEYDAAGNLTRVTQPVNNSTNRVTTYQTNSIGQVLKRSTTVTTDSLTSVDCSYTYDALGDKRSEESGYFGDKTATKKWNFDNHHRVVSSFDELNRETKYTYDLAGNRTGVVDPRDKKYAGTFNLVLDYDKLGRLIDAQLPTLAAGPRPRLQFEYNGNGDLTKRIEPDLQTTEYEYTLRNQLRKGTRGGLVTSYTYDLAGRDDTMTAPSGRIVKKNYDGASRLTRVDENGQMVAQYVYDNAGHRTAVTDGNGNTTKYTYTPEGRPLTVLDPIQSVSSQKKTFNDYDRLGNLTRATDPSSNERQYQYDELGRLIKETTPWKAEITTGYDAWGNPVNRTDARGTAWTRTYTDTHLLATETGTNPTQTASRSFDYDEAGDLKRATDNGLDTFYNTTGGAYQPDPYSLIRSKSETVLGQDLGMKYDYDAKQRLTDVIYPNGNTSHYDYNSLDQITGMSDWIQDNTLTYDAKSGFLTGYSLANRMDTTLTYDARDRLQNVSYSTDGSSIKTYALTYDNAGNVKSKNLNTYDYDKLNRLIGANERGLFQQTPQDIAATTQFTAQDSDYHPTTQVLSFTTTVQPTDTLKLDLAARSIGLDLGNPHQINRLKISPQNAGHRVRQQDIRVYASTNNGGYTKITGWQFTKNTDGSMVLNFPTAFTARYLKINTLWDDRSAINAVIDQATAANTAHALVQVWTLATTKNEAYEYDETGNRVNETITTGSLASQKKDGKYYKNKAGGNLPWLATDSGWYYQYDAAGNRIAKAKALTQPQNLTAPLDPASFQIDTTKEYWTYTWDLKNRLASVSKDGVQIVRYTYDAENLRVARQTLTDTKVFAFGRKGAIAYTKDVTADTTRTYAYFYGEVIGWTDQKGSSPPQKYFATTDHLGSVTAVTDKDAKVVWSSEYDPFGKVSGAVGSYDFDGSYAGHEVDADVGLVYMWNRWQDPETGTFVSEDPARNGGNWYSYAAGNPLSMVDPTGLDATGQAAANAAAGYAGYSLSVGSDGSVTSHANSGPGGGGGPGLTPGLQAISNTFNEGIAARAAGEDTPYTFDLNLGFLRWRFDANRFSIEVGIPFVGYVSLGVDQSGGRNTGLHVAATVFGGGVYLDIGRNDGEHAGVQFSVDTIFGGFDLSLGTNFGSSIDAHVVYFGGLHLGTDWAGYYTPWGSFGYNFLTGSTFSNNGVTRMFGRYSGGGFQANAITNDPNDPFQTGRWTQPRNQADRNAMTHDYTYGIQQQLGTEEEQQAYHNLRNETLRAQAWTLENITSIDPYNQAQSLGQGLFAPLL